jgi:uncharacterized protein (DUF1697 family)
MTRYVALLRGVNLAATNRIAMNELRAVVEDLGHEDVRTYVQSGNLVFGGPSSGAKELAAEIEEAISDAFGLRSAVIIRTGPELARVVSGNPFSGRGPKPTSTHVMFLEDRPSPGAVARLDHERSSPDEFEVEGQEIYLWFPNGSGRSKLTVDYFEKGLQTRATARNWKTVLKLLDMTKES